MSFMSHGLSHVCALHAQSVSNQVFDDDNKAYFDDDHKSPEIPYSREFCFFSSHLKQDGRHNHIPKESIN